MPTLSRSHVKDRGNIMNTFANDLGKSPKSISLNITIIYRKTRPPQTYPYRRIHATRNSLSTAAPSSLFLWINNRKISFVWSPLEPRDGRSVPIRVETFVFAMFRWPLPVISGIQNLADTWRKPASERVGIYGLDHQNGGGFDFRALSEMRTFRAKEDHVSP
jgi:hypothetical protein